MKQRALLAFAAADKAGVNLVVNSGYRTRSHQMRLWQAALRKYGSAKKARRWVLPPDESAHPLGKALDLGPPSAAAWLGKYGYRYGLCRRYSNEPWHFEAVAAIGTRCPPLVDGAEG